MKERGEVCMHGRSLSSQPFHLPMQRGYTKAEAALKKVQVLIKVAMNY